MASITNDAQWVIGFVGLWGIIAASGYALRLTRHHRFFRFQRDEHLDMVLTTSARAQGGFGAVKYIRATTAVGNLKGATEIAQAAGYRSPRKPIAVAVSADLESRLSGDLVVLGLPGKNPTSELVLGHLAEQHPALGLLIEEQGPSCGMSLGGVFAPYSVKLQPGTKIPANDFALIVMWVNPLAVRKRRLIMCGGFTAYSTAAAASYLVDDILHFRYRALRKRHPTLPPFRSRRWVCFAMLIETTLVNDQAVEIKERAFVALPDPGCPPFSPPPPRRRRRWWPRAKQADEPTALPRNEGDLLLGEQQTLDEVPTARDDAVPLIER